MYCVERVCMCALTVTQPRAPVTSIFLDWVRSQLHLALVASATRAGTRLVHEARVGLALPRIRLRTVRCR